MKLRTRRRHPEQSIEDLLPGYLEDGHFEGPASPWRSEDSIDCSGLTPPRAQLHQARVHDDPVQPRSIVALLPRSGASSGTRRGRRPAPRRAHPLRPVESAAPRRADARRRCARALRKAALLTGEQALEQASARSARRALEGHRLVHYRIIAGTVLARRSEVHPEEGHGEQIRDVMTPAPIHAERTSDGRGCGAHDEGMRRRRRTRVRRTTGACSAS